MSTSTKPKIVFIIGPTSSGKTAYSIELAKKLGKAEIISADSRQIYRSLDLSTGKVTVQEMQNIPHHLLDIIDPGEYFSVVDFVNMALLSIEEIQQRGNTPIICGGTGFYIDALLYDYQLPSTTKNEDLRAKLENKETSELFQILKSSLRFPRNLLNLKYFFKNRRTLKKFSHSEYRNNPHRLVRAIEIVNELGYLPELKKVKRFKDSEYQVEIVKLSPDKEILHDKIYKRLEERLAAGMVEEIVRAKEKYNLSYKYLEGLGLEFKNVAKYLQGEFSKEEMKNRLFVEICQYAKRQNSWFKRY